MWLYSYNDLWHTSTPSFRFCVPGARGSSAVSLPHHQAGGTPSWACVCAPSPLRRSAARAIPDTSRMSAAAAERAALADSPDGPASGQKSEQPALELVVDRASPGSPLSKNTDDYEHWIFLKDMQYNNPLCRSEIKKCIHFFYFFTKKKNKCKV